MQPKMMVDIANCTQKSVLISPLVMPVTPANTNSAKISVMIVPPIVSVTDLILEIPYLLVIGYASKVCEANILESNSAEEKVKFNK